MTAIAEQPEAEKSPLRHWHETQVSIEKLRISIGNRVSALGRGVDGVELPVPGEYQQALDKLQELEEIADRAIASALPAFPVWNHWLRHVKGIGPSLAGQMLALLLPPLAERGPSTWYKAAGLTPGDRDGVMRLPRPRSGEGAITYHPYLRRCLFNVATSFVRTGGYYREVYEQRKLRLFRLHCWTAARVYDGWRSNGEAARPAWLDRWFTREAQTAAFVQAQTLSARQRVLLLSAVESGSENDRDRARLTFEAAQRVPSFAVSIALTKLDDDTWPLYRVDSVARWAMTKLFLSHLYEKWLEAEGHTGRRAYVVEQLGHGYIAPPEPKRDGKKL